MASLVTTLEPATASRFRALERLIGNTPLLAIDFEFRGRRRTIYAKSEHLNLTGSIKDRMALHILRQAYAEGRLRPGDTLAEATSGNTGIAFAALGRARRADAEVPVPAARVVLAFRPAVTPANSLSSRGASAPRDLLQVPWQKRPSPRDRYHARSLAICGVMGC